MYHAFSHTKCSCVGVHSVSLRTAEQDRGYDIDISFRKKIPFVFLVSILYHSSWKCILHDIADCKKAGSEFAKHNTSSEVYQQAKLTQ